MDEKPIADIVAVVTFLAALIFRHEVAAVVAPYVVILIASTIGASFALARRKRTPRLEGFIFFFQQVGIALLMTVGAAMGLQTYHPEMLPRITVAPIALLLGFTNWPWLLVKAQAILVGALDLMRGKPGKTP